MATKPEALANLDAAFAEFRSAVDALTAEQRDERWLGSWSIRELLAHISGWHEEMTPALERLARGERATAEGVDYNDADAWNARFAEGAAAAYDDVRARLDASHRAFRAAAESVPEERFGEGKTVNRLVDATGSHHYREHLGQLRAWQREEA